MSVTIDKLEDTAMSEQAQSMVEYLMNEWQLSRKETLATMRKHDQEFYIDKDINGNPLSAEESVETGEINV